MMATAAVTYFSALKIEQLHAYKKTLNRQDKAGRKAADNRIKGVKRTALLFNFGMLALLKYVPSLPYHLLEMAGWKGGYFALSLPLGISFYTFALSGYLFDVTDRKVPAEKRFDRLLLFASYYPLLIEGPICRYGDLMPELLNERKSTAENLYRGGIRVLWGVFKKKVVADRAVLLVDIVFAKDASFGGAINIIGVLFYSLMQYADFSGGIDMVLGISEMMGIHPAENFRQPYFATSLGDFWRRWHITLGAWMRDYVFYPFALSKPVQFLTNRLKQRKLKSLSRTVPAAAGNLLVFFLVGIWHGKSTNFIAWGMYNGLVLAASALMEPYFSRIRTDRYRILKILRTFLIVNIGWFFDRSSSFGHALQMLKNVVLHPDLHQLTDGTISMLGLKTPDVCILAVGVLLVFSISVLKEKGKDITGLLRRKSPVIQFVLIYLLFLITLLFSIPSDHTGFMYAMY
ncbi:MAG: MBOAT family protein [Clostridia bacterium]|nr:MBOAT family protein [Clostridia bacterium]